MKAIASTAQWMNGKKYTVTAISKKPTRLSRNNTAPAKNKPMTALPSILGPTRATLEAEECSYAGQGRKCPDGEHEPRCGADQMCDQCKDPAEEDKTHECTEQHEIEHEIECFAILQHD